MGLIALVEGEAQLQNSALQGGADLLAVDLSRYLKAAAILQQALMVEALPREPQEAPLHLKI